MSSRLVPLCALVVGIAALAACAGADDDVGALESVPTDGGVGVTTDAFPLEIENCGRTLTFDAPPQRAVTGYNPSFELMAALGLGERLIGRTPYVEEGPDGVLPEFRQLYDEVPEISDSISLPAAEEMLALEADFVLSEGYYNFNAENGNATIDELAEAGAQVYITGGWCDADAQLDFQIETLLADVRTIAAIFGVPENGETLAAELQGILDEVAEATSDVEPAPVVLVDAGPDAIFAMGNGMGQQLIELAGAENPFGTSGDTYGEYSAEEIAASGAEAFALITYLPTTADERRAVVEEVAANTPAVTEGRFVEIPASATHPGYRTFFAVRDIAEAVYPDAFTE